MLRSLFLVAHTSFYCHHLLSVHIYIIVCLEHGMESLSWFESSWTLIPVLHLIFSVIFTTCILYSFYFWWFIDKSVCLGHDFWWFIDKSVCLGHDFWWFIDKSVCLGHDFWWFIDKSVCLGHDFHYGY
jgi:hypothetical protein